MPLKDQGGGQKCSACAELSERRSQCSTTEERKQVDAEKQQHIDIVKADRAINQRGNKRASAENNFLKATADKNILKIMIDGMDQSKFSLPRHGRMVGTADFSKLWRPAIHVVGVLVWGLWEMYFLMEADCPKDSSMNCTLVSRALDLTKQLLDEMGDQFGFPQHLIVSADNTPRESKNAFFATYLAWLQFLQCSHTHTTSWTKDSQQWRSKSREQHPSRTLMAYRSF